MSYAAWCVQALRAAQIARLGVEGLGDAMVRAVAGVKRNYNGADGYGGFAYTSPGRSGLTGAGALSLQFLGRPDDPETRSAIAWLSRNAVVTWNLGKIDAAHRRDPVYYWYYATQAMFQQGGSAWSGWNNQFKPALMQSQNVIPKAANGYRDHRSEPRAIGFWHAPEGVTMHGGENNPVFATILCTLMLEVYYRYLPTYQQPEALPGERALHDERDIPLTFVTSTSARQLALPPEALTRWP